ncbi:MAG: phosphoglucosamine mutase, partial [Clostridiales bacterium]|nr:phosphoglucosamine mutase [Clostridiales bacterium]
MRKLFGTDGVRGVANRELTAKLAFDLGWAGARVLAKERRHKPLILIGTDTRLSCDMLEGAMVAGICSTGADVITVGVIPTPGVAYLTTQYHADAGVVISASHNSFEFNGIKFFDGSGYKLPDAIEAEIEVMIAGGGDWNDRGGDYVAPVGDTLGRRRVESSAIDDYRGHLRDSAGFDLTGLRIALDCANGAACEIAPSLFSALGADVFAFSVDPNGCNINDRCGSTHIGALRRHMQNSSADIGFAFDGDADRMLAVDETGGLIDGDALMALLAIDMKKKGRLKKDTVVATVMSNIGLELAVRKQGIRLVRTAVGDRYVLEEMVKNGYNIGGEQSGHIICLDGNTTGDGIYAALRFLQVLRDCGGRASELASVVKMAPQTIRNAKVANDKKAAYLEDPLIRERCAKLDALFHGEGRVLIRPSGTEPLVRVMIEANDQNLIDAEAEALA